MFSTNFPTDSNRSITDSTKGRKILFCSSSLEYPQKSLRSTVHWLFPVRPSGMNGRGDFKSAGVGTGKFVGCVCRRCYTHFISEPPEQRIRKGLFFFICLWIVSSWPTLKCHFTSYSCFSHHLFLKFSPVFHSCLYVIHFLSFEFKIYDSNVCHFHFCHLLSKFRLNKVCHYLHKFKKSHKTHKTKWKSIMTSTPSGYREKK